MNNENNQNINPQETNNVQPEVSMGGVAQQAPVEQVVAQPEMVMEPSTNQVPVEPAQSVAPKKKSLGKVFIVLCMLIIGAVFSFLGNTILYFIGIVLVVVSLILSIVQIKNKSKLSIITLILALLLLIGNGVFIFLAYSNGNKKSDELTDSTYVAIAKGYIIAVEGSVLSEECNDKTAEKVNYLSDVEGMDNVVSPYGNAINREESYVKIVPKVKDNSCEYEFYIYLTDGTYSIGSANNPILEKNITVDTITSVNTK